MFTLAIKDLKIFLKDRKAILLTFLLPVALITLFTIAYGGLFGKPNPQPEYLLIHDDDSSSFSTALTDKLSAVEGMEIQAVDTSSGAALVKGGRRLAMLYLGMGLQDSVNQGGSLPLYLWYDEGRRIETGMLQEVLMSVIAPEIEQVRNQQRIKSFMIQRYGMMGEDFVNDLVGDVNQFIANDDESGPLIKGVGLAARENINWGLIQAVAGVAVMMLLFSVAAIGGSIIEERDEGTLKRLLISPVKAEHILLGKLFYALVIAVAQLLIMFIFGWLAFGLEIWGNPIGLLLNIFATALACSSFGIFLAAISKSRRQVESLSTIVILIMSAIGGSMIPLFIMPDIMHKLAVISVNYWSMEAFFDILARDAGFLSILWKVGILIGMSALLLWVSLFYFKKRYLSPK